MIKEYEGKTEQEAVNKAALELNLDVSDLDVEVLDEGRKGLFGKKTVRIRITVDDEKETQKSAFEEALDEEISRFNESENTEPDVDEDVQEKVCDFVKGVIVNMGYEATVSVVSVTGKKVSLDIQSADSNIIIGRKGKNLDALQTIANAYANQLDGNARIILDSEDYRIRHEQQIIKNAYRVASQVKKTGRSQLLEPMNPFERRLVHTALNDVTGIETKSEGEGLYKQVRILCTRNRH